ncbi:ABC transporter ATP-binding protein [Flaviaesturariibacter amylovorans]|uniref:ABC transporter domain-containing protein n=1 Tax=Flaviaesturariibacter amylovorans TaxID=1084520 RepID=A0ABP8GA52_9BACT
MPQLSERLAEVRSYFAHGDHHLGYRRLLDAALETGNFDVYRATLRFCDEWDATPEADRGRTVTDRVSGLLALIETGHRPPPPAGTGPRLEAEGVAKRYHQGAFSLAPVNVRLHHGQIIGLVGENGNGKTTLLRLLNGDLRPDAGTIRYHFAPAGTAAYDVRSRIAFIPQRPQSWYGSLMDNLQFASTFAGLTGEENELWTEMVIARMGLRPYRTYNWSRISSGYKMRFELARTLLRKPQVLLLDEPLANLDMLAQQIILEDLKFLAASETMPLSIILSSQQLYEVEKVSNEVIFLQRGVARYQPGAPLDEAPEEKTALVLELETAATRDELEALLGPAGLQQLTFNGGVHILYFAPGTGTGDVLTLLGGSGLPVRYFRDISHSSRRFFVA